MSTITDTLDIAGATIRHIDESPIPFLNGFIQAGDPEVAEAIIASYAEEKARTKAMLLAHFTKK